MWETNCWHGKQILFPNNAEQYAKDWGDNYVRAALLVEKQPRRFLRP